MKTLRTRCRRCWGEWGGVFPP